MFSSSGRSFSAAGVFAFSLVLASTSVHASSFDISNASTTAQTLGSASGQTGVIEASGSLTVSGGTVAVTVSGNNATLTNLGTLKQTGNDRAIRDNTGVTGLTVTNGSASNSSALMQTADADVIQMNKAGGKIVFNNYGTLTSLNASKGGAQAIDFNAITAAGSNILNNYVTGLIQTQDADAVRPGLNGFVYNYGTIKSTVTTDAGSDGIDLQNNSGATIVNYGTGSVYGARHGITGGAADSSVNFAASISNNLGGIIQGNNGSGINLDGFNAKQVVTIVNGGTIQGNGVTGDGDGIDVDGLVSLTNTGTIKSLNSFSATTPAQSEGVTVGGGTIDNHGTIEGDVASGNSNAVGRGITLAGVDTSGTPEPIYGNSTVHNYNGGVIKGQSDSAIAVGGGASGFTVTITNDAGGTMLGGGALNAAIRTGADNDTINNAGSIDGSSSGKAIDMGAGNNALNVTGGSALIVGDVSGGVGGTNTMTMDLGTGNSFSYASSLSNFNSVELKSGHATLSGANGYTGQTRIGGGTLTLQGANRVASASALALNGGELELAGVSGPNAQTFSSLSLGGDSIIDLDLSSLTFTTLGLIGAHTLSVLNFFAASSPDYAIRFLGDYSLNASFLTLIGETTINSIAAGFRFDGLYTDVVPVPLPAGWLLLLSALLLWSMAPKGLKALAEKR